MDNVLILCKNPFGEQELQRLLQRSNFEVYCSANLLHHNEPVFVSYFSVIIISETISTFELAKMLPRLVNHKIPIIRKGEIEKKENSKLDWMDNSISEWINYSSSNADIIDKVATCVLKHSNDDNLNANDDSVKLTTDDYTFFLQSLTEKERILLLRLYEAEKLFISRTNLCEMIWDGELSKSNLCQLSALIYRLKTKVEKLGISEDGIKTAWGKGYRIEKSLFDFLKWNDFTEA